MSKRNIHCKSKFVLSSGDKDDVNDFKEKLSELKEERDRSISDKNDLEIQSKFRICDTDEEFTPVVLPKIDFCETPPNSCKNELDNAKHIYPQISDLCENDREQIAKLIGEIMRYKDICKKHDEDYQRILDENLKKKQKIIQLEQDLSAFKLGCKAKDKDIKFLTDAHKIQETALRKQILEFQHTIMTLTKEKLNLEIDLQKLKKQNEHLTHINTSVDKEKQNVKKKYILMKERLKMCIDLMGGENPLKSFIRHLSDEKCTEVKKGNNELCSKSESKTKISFKLPEADQEMLGNRNELSPDDALISELFFLPNQQTFPDFQMFSSFAFQ